MTTAQRMAALDGLKAFCATAPRTNPDTYNQAVADYLKSRPEFEASGVGDDSCVWARFKDGRMLVLANNRGPDPGAKSADRAHEAATRSVMPSSRKTYAVNGMGPGFIDCSEDVAGDLLTTGYNVTAGGFTVSTLKAATEAGVFYMDTHGGKCMARTGARVFALATTEEVSAESDEAYKADLDAGRLVYFTVDWDVTVPGHWTSQVHYGFTADFVKAYVNVGPNSLVYIDACYGFNDAMIAAFQSKGASTYMGWDDKVLDRDAARNSRYFFDRVLGTNRTPPLPDPPERPFDILTVYGDMNAKGWLTSIGELRYAAKDGADPIGTLAPSIMRLQVDEAIDTLYIAGNFGENPGAEGKVTVGGTQVPIKSWDTQTIAVTIPVQGSGSAGDVVVEVRGHRSNVVQLTEWRPTIRFTFHNLGTMQYSMVVHAHIRVDIHAYRFVFDETPRQGEWPFTFAKDSTATVAASGFYADPNGATFTLERSGPEEVPLNGDADRTFSGSGSVLTSGPGGAKLMNILIDGRVANGLLTTVDMPGGIHYTAYDELQFSTASFGDGSEAALAAGLNDSYELTGGLRQIYASELEWDRCVPLYPPDPGASRAPQR